MQVIKAGYTKNMFIFINILPIRHLSNSFQRHQVDLIKEAKDFKEFNGVISKL